MGTKMGANCDHFERMGSQVHVVEVHHLLNDEVEASWKRKIQSCCFALGEGRQFHDVVMSDIHWAIVGHAVHLDVAIEEVGRVVVGPEIQLDEEQSRHYLEVIDCH